MEKSQSIWSVVGALALLGLAAWFFFGGGLDQQVARDMDAINSQVANDAVAQYQIAERNGGPMDKCLAAQMVMAAFLQAKDEPNYIKWKGVQQTQCTAAGLPP